MIDFDKLPCQHHMEALSRIETKLDTTLEILKDHETRIRGVEKWRNVLAGAWAVIVAVFGATFQFGHWGNK